MPRIIITDFKARLKSFARRVEMDRAVLYSILARAWAIVAGIVTFILIANKFTPVIQGFYFTFGSILVLQVFAELGMGVVISQFASHEWSNLGLDQNRGIAGDADSLSRLSSLTQIAVKWYFIAAVFVIAGWSFGGYVFFSQSATQGVNWKLPWIALCIFTGINLFSTAVWSLLEGCNQISNVYFFRLSQGLLVSLAGWSAVILGANLWTASVVSLAGLIYASLFLRKNYWQFFKTLLLVKPAGPLLNWRSDILPFQWRIALTWASGYFMGYFFVPVLFRYHGPVIAGQMGMTWSIVGAVPLAGWAWLGPKVPQFAMMAAQKRYVEMDRLFWRMLIIVTGITILVAAAVWLSVFTLSYYHNFLASRILSPLPTALFLIAGVINTAACPMSIYMRAHKKEPIMFLQVLASLMIALSVWLLGKYYSVAEMAVGYLTVIAIVFFPAIAVIWQRFRVQWHNYPHNDK